MIKKIASVFISIGLLASCSGSPSNCGVNNGRFYPCPSSPNCVSSQASIDDAEHYIEPIIYKGDISTAQQRLTEVLQSQENARIALIEDGYLLSEFTSSFFGFVDDVEFYLVEDREKTVIEVRSLSRIGYSDFGVNRKRIEDIRALMP